MSRKSAARRRIARCLRPGPPPGSSRPTRGPGGPVRAGARAASYRGTPGSVGILAGALLPALARESNPRHPRPLLGALPSELARSSGNRTRSWILGPGRCLTPSRLKPRRQNPSTECPPPITAGESPREARAPPAGGISSLCSPFSVVVVSGAKSAHTKKASRESREARKLLTLYVREPRLQRSLLDRPCRFEYEDGPELAVGFHRCVVPVPKGARSMYKRPRGCQEAN